MYSLRWRHNGRDSVSNHQPHDCLLNRLFRRRSKKTSKLRATGLCAVNSPGTGEFPAQMASNAENVSIWWRHHVSYRRKSTKFWLLGHLRIVLYMPTQLRNPLIWITHGKKAWIWQFLTMRMNYTKSTNYLRRWGMFHHAVGTLKPSDAYIRR